jgi:hypothetical protein
MSMSVREFNDILNRLAWSLEIAADRSGRSYSRIRKQAAGSSPIDEPLAAWLRRFTAVLDDRPPQLAPSDPETREMPIPARPAFIEGFSR